MRPIVKRNLRRQGDGAFAEYEKARQSCGTRESVERGKCEGAQGTLRAPSITDIGPVRHERRSTIRDAALVREMQLNPPVEIVELLARKKTAIDINEGFSVALGNEFEFACIATCPQEIGDGCQPIGGQFQVEVGSSPLIRMPSQSERRELFQKHVFEQQLSGLTSILGEYRLADTNLMGTGTISGSSLTAAARDPWIGVCRRKFGGVWCKGGIMLTQLGSTFATMNSGSGFVHACVGVIGAELCWLKL